MLHFIRLFTTTQSIKQTVPDISQKEPFMTDLEINLTRVIIGHTDLMKNDLYYDTYCIGINTIFASIFPFIALTFFNMRIALELRCKKVIPSWFSRW